jgi:pilus assembly protein Flp/PilA
MTLLSRFAACQSGATAIEYSLIGGLIGLAIIAAAQSVGNELKVPFQEVEAGFKQGD